MNRFKEMENFLQEHKIKDINTTQIYQDLQKYGHDRLTYTTYTDALGYGIYQNLTLGKNNGWLQIISDDINDIPVKLYLNLDEEIDYRNIKEIIKYLDQNQIKTNSKISKKTRSDSFTLRVDITSSVDLINYINTHFTKEDGFLKTNPFLYRENLVGIAYDDKLSYNEVLSTIMSKYLNERIKEEKNTSLNDFNNYLKKENDKYDLYLMTKDEKLLEKDLLYENNFSYFHNKEACITNIQEVINMISINIDETKNLNDVLETISSFQKITKVEQNKSSSIKK